MTKSREYVLYSDCTMANPNGDMINENRPRQDEKSGKLEMSDVRIKRYVRDEWVNRNFDVFVKPVMNDNGKFLDCKSVAKKVMDENKLKKENLEDFIKQNYIDVKLFGAVITDPKFNIMGPLQVMWSRSINTAEINFAQGTSSFTSKSEAAQGTIWSKYFTPYALFRTYMVYNDIVAQKQNINVSDEDMDNFKDALINGIKNYKSTSKNQMPRLLIEVIYKDNYIDGELDYINTKFNVDEDKLRSIDEITFNLNSLAKFYEGNVNKIDEINIYKQAKVNIINGSDKFSYYDI